jgi:hypothetical protein
MAGASMQRERRVCLVEDPEDSREVAVFVAGLADRMAGRAVVHPMPGLLSREELASEILVALGKRFDALRAERVRSRAWELVDTWIRAEQVSDLFVLRAQLLPPALWDELADLAGGAHLHLWLVAQGPKARTASTLAGIRAERWAPAVFTRWWSQALPVRDATAETDTFPEVPADGFLTFRSSCRQLIDEVAFGRVDREYCHSMQATARWLEEWSPLHRHAPHEELLDGVGGHIQGLLVTSSCAAEALTRFRGAQAAFFCAGWLVEHSPRLLPSATAPLDSLGPGLDLVAAARIRRLCTPRAAAVTVLFLAAGFSAQAMSQLNLADVVHDGAAVAVGQDRFSIPDYAQSLLRAQLIEREREGAARSDPLFVHPRTGERQGASALRNTLRAVGRWTAVAVGQFDSWGIGNDSESWLRAHHVSLARLESLPGGSSR